MGKSVHVRALTAFLLIACGVAAARQCCQQIRTGIRLLKPFDRLLHDGCPIDHGTHTNQQLLLVGGYREGLCFFKLEISIMFAAIESLRNQYQQVTDNHGHP